ncbi:MAG: acyltransferase, partial [Eubacteriales bacterium]|nr:acyltransferase [Eubacteriales bacterium]
RQTDRQTVNIRNSNIELLKIFAIFLIIIFHFNQTLTATGNNSLGYLINIEEYAKTRPYTAYILAVFQRFGELGNNIFFVCSAFFLVDIKKSYWKKMFSLISDVWLVSVIFLCIILFVGTVAIDGEIILKCLFPTTFANNWYITSYVCFLAVFPFLNLIISSLSKKRHLIAIAFLFFIDFSSGSSSMFKNWFFVYFLIAYIKKYLIFIAESKTKNIVLLIFALGLLIFSKLYVIVGIRFSTILKYFDKAIHKTNIIYVLFAISSFNLFSKIKIKSRIINRISKQSFLIYIIHENILIRRYYRPIVWTYVYENIGYEHIVGLIIILAVLTFMGSLALSLIYEKTLGRLSKRISEKIYPRIESIGIKVTDRLIKIR